MPKAKIFKDDWGWNFQVYRQGVLVYKIGGLSSFGLAVFSYFCFRNSYFNACAKIHEANLDKMMVN